MALHWIPMHKGGKEEVSEENIMLKTIDRINPRRAGQVAPLAKADHLNPETARGFLGWIT